MARTLLTPKQAAARANTSERSLERYRQNGGGPDYVRLGARAIRYDPDDLDTWIANHKYPHRAAELARASHPEKQTAGL